MKCRNCEDSGYEWESDDCCKKCEKGKETQHENNIQALRYHNKRVRQLRKSIKSYKEKKTNES